MPEAQNAAQPGARVDPLKGYNWKILIDGVPVGDFVYCSGVEVVVDAISYSEGGNPVERKLPGRTHYPPITLENGLTQSTLLWRWLQSAVKGPAQRKLVSIVMLGSDGTTELLRWNLHDAWPVRFRVKPLDASTSLVAIGVLEVACETIEQDPGTAGSA